MAVWILLGGLRFVLKYGLRHVNQKTIIFKKNMYCNVLCVLYHAISDHISCYNKI